MASGESSEVSDSEEEEDRLARGRLVRLEEELWEGASSRARRISTGGRSRCIGMGRGAEKREEGIKASQNCGRT